MKYYFGMLMGAVAMTVTIVNFATFGQSFEYYFIVTPVVGIITFGGKEIADRLEKYEEGR